MRENGRENYFFAHTLTLCRLFSSCFLILRDENKNHEKKVPKSRMNKRISFCHHDFGILSVFPNYTQTKNNLKIPKRRLEAVFLKLVENVSPGN